MRWRNATLRKRAGKSRRTIAGNGLPKGHATGRFPIDPGDDAYAYDPRWPASAAPPSASPFVRRASARERASRTSPGVPVFLMTCT